ncbi:MAG: metal-dependent hydrolase [Gemmataceae bacterium]
MANFRGHLTFSASLGATYGGLLAWQLGVDWGTSALAAGLTAVGGMLPDLDSDSGIPVREMFHLAAIVIPGMFLRRLHHGWQLADEQILVVVGAMYLGIRYGLSALFKRITVHRGMFHSIPAMLIAGLATFLIYHHPDNRPRVILAVAVMIGFLSHLLLDELYSVDFRGLKPKLNKYAGSALKFASPSQLATGITYLLLLALGFLAFLETGTKFDEQKPVAVQMPQQEK